jgi:hypothetical protein
LHAVNSALACADHTRVHSYPKPQLIGCRIPSSSRRVREKTRPPAAFDPQSTRASDLFLNCAAAPRRLCPQVRATPAPLAQFPRAPFLNRRDAAPPSGRVPRFVTPGVVLSPRAANSLPQLVPTSPVDTTNEHQVKPPEWYPSAASRVKCMPQEHEDRERVGHPPNFQNCVFPSSVNF